MVHSGYHPLKHCPLRLVLGWYTVDTIQSPLRLVDGAQWVSSSQMVHRGYHPLKIRPLRLVLGWYTVNIILLNIVLLG